MSLVEKLRRALEQELLAAGPHAATLCEGWTTTDLAAHLYVRENKLAAAAGMFVPALASTLERETVKAKQKGYEQLVSEWAHGRGAKLPRAVDEKMNTAEYYVHLYDVAAPRGGEPFALSEAENAELFTAGTALSKVLLRKSKGPVVFEPTGGRRLVAFDRLGVAEQGDAVACVRGSAGAIILWLYGRSVPGIAIDDPLGLARRSSI